MYMYIYIYIGQDTLCVLAEINLSMYSVDRDNRYMRTTYTDSRKTYTYTHVHNICYVYMLYLFTYYRDLLNTY